MIRTSTLIRLREALGLAMLELPQDSPAYAKCAAAHLSLSLELEVTLPKLVEVVNE